LRQPRRGPARRAGQRRRRVNARGGLARPRRGDTGVRAAFTGSRDRRPLRARSLPGAHRLGAPLRCATGPRPTAPRLPLDAPRLTATATYSTPLEPRDVTSSAGRRSGAEDALVSGSARARRAFMPRLNAADEGWTIDARGSAPRLSVWRPAGVAARLGVRVERQRQRAAARRGLGRRGPGGSPGGRGGGARR